MKAYFDGWDEDENKLSTGDYAKLDFENEPKNIENDEWAYFYYSHYEEPYIDWLPVCNFVTEWINEKYRFKIHNQSLFVIKNCGPHGKSIPLKEAESICNNLFFQEWNVHLIIPGISPETAVFICH